MRMNVWARVARKPIVWCTAVVCLTAIAGSAVAQLQPRYPAPRPVRHAPPASPQQAEVQASNEAPQRTTATYDDWVVECQTQTKPSAEKVCDMAQVAQVQGRNIPFSRIAIPRPGPGQPVKLVVQVPVNVSIQPAVRLQLDNADRGWSAPFARCVPVGCFAEFAFNEDAVSKLRSAPAGPGKVSFADASGHEIAVPLSFRGFDQAFDALAKE